LDNEEPRVRLASPLGKTLHCLEQQLPDVEDPADPLLLEQVLNCAPPNVTLDCGREAESCNM